MNSFYLFKSSPIAVLILVSLAACGQDPSTKIFNEAELLLSRGEYREAIEAHTELIKSHPESPLAPKSLYKKAAIHYRYLNDIETALKTYDELAYLYPESDKLIEAAMDRGEIYSALGQHWKAVEEYEWLLERGVGEERERYQYLIGMEYYKMNDFRQARIEFAEILQNNGQTPLAPNIHFRIASAYYLEGNLPDGLTAYEAVIALFPDNPLALESSVNIAQIHTDAGRFSEALELLTKIKEDGAWPESGLIEMRIALIEERIKNPRHKGKKRGR